MNPTLVIAFVAIAGLLMMGALGTAIYVGIKPRMRLKKRIADIGTIGGNVSSKAESRRQKRIQDKIKGLDKSKQSQGQGDRIRAAMMQAGLKPVLKNYVIGSIISGVIVVLIFMAMGFPPISVPLAGLAGMVGLPKLVLNIMAGKRQSRFTEKFAEAIDVIVRGVRSGLPVGECLSIIAREFTGPVGEEFTMIIEGQRLGLNLENIMERGLERMPTAEFKFFAIVLQIQKQTGGNLADTLENLTGVLRDRKKMKDKIQALSSEAKSSAMIIASLPFFVMGMLSIINYEYVSQLFITETGNILLASGGFWMVLGIAVMWKMINFEI